MKVKKLAIIVPSLSDGGAEKVAANLSIIYKELGYEVYIILYENRVSFDYEGIIIDLKIKKKNGVSKIFRDYEIYSKLKKVKKQYKFDVVISHLPKTDLMNCLSKQNEKVITTIHNNIDIDYPSYMKRALPYIARKSDLIASVSKVGEQYIKSCYKKANVKTIYNPQILENIKVLANDEISEIPNDIFENEVIINIGRLNIQKGQWHLIRSFSKLLLSKPNAKLLIVGKGELENELKELTKKLGIEKSVIFVGFNKNPYKFIQKSDLYVGTSLYEGFGMTIVEAMSLGVPAISTDCISGPREIIAPDKFNEEIDYSQIQEYGILTSNFGSTISIEDIEVSCYEKHLAEDMLKLLNDKEEYDKLSKLSIERSKAFDYKNIKKVWEKELSILLGER